MIGKDYTEQEKDFRFQSVIKDIKSEQESRSTLDYFLKKTYSYGRKAKYWQKEMVDNNQFLLSVELQPHMFVRCMWIFLLFFQISSNEHDHNIIVEIAQSKAGILS